MFRLQRRKLRKKLSGTVSICIFSMIELDKLQSNARLVLHSFNFAEEEEIFDIGDKSWRRCVTGPDGV